MPNTDLGFNIFATDRASGAFRGMARSVDEVVDKLNKLDRQHAEAEADVDTTRAKRKLDALDRKLNKLTFRKALVTAAVIASPAALSALASLTAGIAGATTLFGSAGLAATGFGTAAVGSMKRVTEARKELAEADANAAAILDTLSDAQKASIRDIDRLADSWNAFLDTNDPAVLRAMGDGMEAIRDLLPTLTPLVQAGAGAFGTFADQISGLARSQGWSDITHDGSRLASDLLPKLGESAVNAAVGVGKLATAFGPLAENIADGLVRLTDRFVRWSDQVAQSAGFRDFMDYVAQVGPQLLETLGAVAQAIGDIAVAAGPLAGPLLNIIEALADIVTTLGDASPLLLNAAAATITFMGASRLLGSALVGPTSRVAAYKGAIAAIPGVAGKAKLALRGFMGALGGPWGVAIAAGVTLLGIFANKNDETAASIAEVRQTLDEQTGAITENTVAWAAQEIAQSGIASQARDLGISYDLVAGAVLGNAEAQAQLNTELAQSAAPVAAGSTQLAAYGDEAAHTDGRVKKLKEKIYGLAGQVSQAQDDQKLYNSIMRAAGGQFDRTRDAAKSYEDALRDVDNMLRRLRGITNVRRALRQQEQAFDDAKAAAKKYRKEHGNMKGALDRTTEAGRRNEQTLDDIQTATLDTVDALNKHGASEKRVAAAVDHGRDQLRQAARQMGLSGEAARRLVNKLLPLDKEYSPRTHLKGAKETKRQIQDVIDKLRDLDGQSATATMRTNRIITTLEVYKATGRDTYGGLQRASGGEIPTSMGTPGRDSVPLLAMPGEFVVRTAIAQQHLPFLQALNAGLVRPMANGGQVTPSLRLSSPVSVAAPNVQVFIGDEEITSRVQVVVRDSIDAYDRQTARELANGVV